MKHGFYAFVLYWPGNEMLTLNINERFPLFMQLDSCHIQDVKTVQSKVVVSAAAEIQINPTHIRFV